MTFIPLCVALQQVPSASEEQHHLAMCRLQPEEISLIPPRATPKRRAEFTAGRVAARTAVSRLLGDLPSSSSILILREGMGPTGRPIVVLTGGTDVPRTPHVSISHADGLAVAAASFGNIGIDVASIQSQERSFVDDTFSPMELARWADWLRSEKYSALTITTAFAAKEAALKWLGTGFALPLRAIEIRPVDAGIEEEPASFPTPNSLFRVTVIERDSDDSRILTCRFAQMEDKISILLVN